MAADLIGKRVLVIEDDYRLASELSLAVEIEGGDVVVPYTDVEGGIHALHNDDIDAAVLDVRLRSGTVSDLADRDDVPERFREIRHLGKPVDLHQFKLALFATITEYNTD